MDELNGNDSDDSDETYEVVLDDEESTEVFTESDLDTSDDELAELRRGRLKK